ncbi:GumC family protein [Marinibactrum halimedae]|nr:hypothetical protein [Marinibactrum halimedae]MCD9460686.1 hypothetical protein [Marinibactrum halimedae]
MDLVLPGTGANANVTLDEVGQVVSSTTAPFASGGFNPRVNYKEILMSRRVIENASEKTSIDPKRFGTPKIRLTEQTSILNIEISGRSQEQAQNKAWALYKSLQEELDRLRTDEILRRDASIKAVLDKYRERLNAARAAIIDFQQRSIIISGDQLDKLMAMLSNIEEKQLYVKAESKRIGDYVHQLSTDLGVSSAMAGQAFILQSDSAFRSYLNEFSKSSASLSEYQSRWGLNHPRVKAEKARLDTAKEQLLVRSQKLVGPNAAHTFTTLDLQFNPKRAQLFSDLMTAYAQLQGHEAELQDLSLSEAMMTDKLKVYSREAAELDRLQREFDLAEAVFTSAAARLEASKADVFASYPVVQILTDPSYPTSIASPKKALAIAAGIFGAFFITFALVVVCQRNVIIQAVLKTH